MKLNKNNQIISATVGELEVRLKQQKSAEQSKLVVISHPHPLYGGTMDNKVVTTLERAFYNLGFHTVTYNFRGVGASHGEYDNGVGEQQDLKDVMQWAQHLLEPETTVLAGFSFGSYVILKGLSNYSGVNGLCTVAPPVGLYDFSSIDNIQPEWTLIQGGADEVVSAKEILDWAMSRKTIPDVYWRAKASHFFHGELIWLRKVVETSFG